MSQFRDNSIFWIDADKIKPNPFQPRREFDPDKLNDLAESIKQYGLLQPLTVTRKEIQRDDGSLYTEYELIAGERRLRASKIAGLSQIPSIIRSNEESDRVKLELAIIENLQREDLNPIERAEAFKQLTNEFKFKHTEVAKRIGKSREYVSNTIRLLSLPEDIKNALTLGKITEGHARPLLMLSDRPEEQNTLFKEVMYKKLTVREAEGIARRVAYDKVRKQSRSFDPGLIEMEERFAESLGTRVLIEKRQVGGKIMIDFFSDDDLEKLLTMINGFKSVEKAKPSAMLDKYIKNTDNVAGGEIPLAQKSANRASEDGDEDEAKEEEDSLELETIRSEDISATEERIKKDTSEETENKDILVTEPFHSEDERFEPNGAEEGTASEENGADAELEKRQKEEVELLDDSSPEDEKEDLHSLENFSI